MGITGAKEPVHMAKLVLVGKVRSLDLGRGIREVLWRGPGVRFRSKAGYVWVG